MSYVDFLTENRLVSRLLDASNPRLAKVAMLAVGVLAILLAATSYLAFGALRGERVAQEQVTEAQLAVSHAADLQHSVLTVASAQRGYLLTHDQSYLASSTEAQGKIAPALAALRAASAGNPSAVLKLNELQRLIDGQAARMERMDALERAGRHVDAVALLGSPQDGQSTTAILSQIGRFTVLATSELDQRVSALQDARSNSLQLLYLLVFVGFSLLVVAALIGLDLNHALKQEAASSARLERLERIDELTGLANRQEMLRALDRLMGAARRTGRPLALALLDIDHFKQVNGTYGYPAGDDVIRTVARLAVGIMREQDLIGRLGGEEFLVAFPDCDAPEAVQACERLRRAIALTNVSGDGEAELKVSLSSGVTQMLASDTPGGLIARADAALHAAKQGGRDQVRLAA